MLLKYLLSFSVKADRAPQLKAAVRQHQLERFAAPAFTDG
jgi:hypothetical protein